MECGQPDCESARKNELVLSVPSVLFALCSLC
jgi:hypothetical protein